MKVSQVPNSISCQLILYINRKNAKSRIYHLKNEYLLFVTAMSKETISEEVELDIPSRINWKRNFAKIR